ncbi:MAG: non-canonical purine NTP diphosphatase [Muribaculaceae bacterium]|nr:non-canonical purine NTP diphosphatase [Muribaculaceae bacterium]
MENKEPTIVFATNNAHKIEEAREILRGKIKVKSLSDIGCHDDIPETAETLTGNALIKARWVKEKYGYDCFADDTGLMVEALGGAPGVYSARYAGDHCSPVDNIKLLLEKMEGEKNRKAKFVTVVALILGDNEYIFEGEVKGLISETHSGVNGFGYDPVFVPENSSLSFAEMTSEDKNAISHRGRAMRKLADFLTRN